MHALQTLNTDINITISSFPENGIEPNFLKTIGEDGIKTHLFGIRGSYDLGAISTVRNYLSAKNISILCTHDYRTQFIGFWATRNTGVRWIAFSRGWTRENLKVFVFNLMDRVILRFADHLIAVSHAQKNKLKRLLISENKITVVHNAVRSNIFLSIEKVDLKEKFNWPDDTIVCISGGRFSHEKGTIYLARAAVRAIRQNNRLRFVLFGDGPDIEKIRNIISQSGCGDRIMCPGFEKNFIGCLKGADLFVNPSLSEGLPNVVLEAMVLGVPVLATSVGGVPEIIIDNVNGLMIPPRDIDALVEGILFLSGNQDEAVKLATEARRSIDSKFSFEQQNEKLNLIYRNLSV